MQRELKQIGKKGEELLKIDKQLDIVHSILNKVMDNKRLGIRLDFKFTDKEDKNRDDERTKRLMAQVEDTIARANRTLGLRDIREEYRRDCLGDSWDSNDHREKAGLSIELGDELTLDIFAKFSTHYKARRKELKKEIKGIINKLKT